MGNIFLNINNSENFDILKGKDTHLKKKALNHLKRSNSFISTNIPYFLEQNKIEIDAASKTPINRKKSLKTQNRIASSSDVFDILNDDYAISYKISLLLQ